MLVCICSSTIRDKIIPHAVSWFTGEAVESDFDTDEDGDGDEEGEDDDEDDDEEEDDDDDDEEEEDEGKGKSKSKVWYRFLNLAFLLHSHQITDY